MNMGWIELKRLQNECQIRSNCRWKELRGFWWQPIMATLQLPGQFISIFDYPGINYENRKSMNIPDNHDLSCIDYYRLIFPRYSQNIPIKTLHLKGAVYRPLAAFMAFSIGLGESGLKEF